MIRVYVECHPDRVLASIAGELPRKRIEHTAGKGEVCRRLERRQNRVGIVDEDPGRAQPHYMDSLQEEDVDDEHGLKVLHDVRNCNRLIVIRPRLEEWVLRGARDADMDVKEYDLPNDPMRLHEVIRLSLGKFEDLLKDLRGKGGHLKAFEDKLKDIMSAC